MFICGEVVKVGKLNEEYLHNFAKELIFFLTLFEPSKKNHAENARNLLKLDIGIQTVFVGDELKLNPTITAMYFLFIITSLFIMEANQQNLSEVKVEDLDIDIVSVNQQVRNLKQFDENSDEFRRFYAELQKRAP